MPGNPNFLVGGLAFIRPPKVCIKPDQDIIQSDPFLTITIESITANPSPATDWTVNITGHWRPGVLPPLVFASVQYAPPEIGFGFIWLGGDNIPSSFTTADLDHYVQLDVTVNAARYDSSYFRLPRHPQ